MSMGPEVFGIELFTLLLLVSGIFYLVAAILVYKPMKLEKNELIGALFAFLTYQAISMFFMGVEMYTHNLFYGNIAALSIFIGSAYMLKFPLSKLSQGVRNVSFFLVLIVSLSIFVWFIQTPERQMELMHFVMWYDIVVNGIIVGGSILLFALKAVEGMKRKKAAAGGAGVVSCCVVANATMLTGSLAVSAVFQFLAPLLIIYSIRSGKFSKTNEAVGNVGGNKEAVV